MQRMYQTALEEHLQSHQQMLFLAGPRQVGKTTISLAAAAFTDNFFYFNWDTQEHRQLMLQGPVTLASQLNLEQLREKSTIVVFDEIHKYAKWKAFLKGFYDNYKNRVKIIVTGSAKLNVYRTGGDSLMGRYFLYRMHPLTVAECISQKINHHEIRQPQRIAADTFKNLWDFGGFPEPFLKANSRFANQWHKLRHQQLFRKDIRRQLETLAHLLEQQTAQLLNYTSLANKINISVNTIKRWLITLENFYYCFLIKPWTKNITSSLLKEPKVYLWDWAEIKNPGARAENFVACHLLKAIHFWNDQGLGKYDLYFLRDKEKREVDFLVTKDKKPWFLVEVKNSNNHGISDALYRFQKQTKAPHAFQVVINAEYVNIDCFTQNEPVIVPAQTFLSQLI